MTEHWRDEDADTHEQAMARRGQRSDHKHVTRLHDGPTLTAAEIDVVEKRIAQGIQPTFGHIRGLMRAYRALEAENDRLRRVERLVRTWAAATDALESFPSSGVYVMERGRDYYDRDAYAEWEAEINRREDAFGAATAALRAALEPKEGE